MQEIRWGIIIVAKKNAVYKVCGEKNYVHGRFFYKICFSSGEKHGKI